MSCFFIHCFVNCCECNVFLFLLFNFTLWIAIMLNRAYKCWFIRIFNVHKTIQLQKTFGERLLCRLRIFNLTKILIYLMGLIIRRFINTRVSCYILGVSGTQLESSCPAVLKPTVHQSQNQDVKNGRWTFSNGTERLHTEAARYLKFWKGQNLPRITRSFPNYRTRGVKGLEGNAMLFTGVVERASSFTLVGMRVTGRAAAARLLRLRSRLAVLRMSRGDIPAAQSLKMFGYSVALFCRYTDTNKLPFYHPFYFLTTFVWSVIFTFLNITILIVFLDLWRILQLFVKNTILNNSY